MTTKVFTTIMATSIILMIMAVAFSFIMKEERTCADTISTNQWIICE